MSLLSVAAVSAAGQPWSTFLFVNTNSNKRTIARVIRSHAINTARKSELSISTVIISEMESFIYTGRIFHMALDPKKEK